MGATASLIGLASVALVFATRDLASIMLVDSAHIQESDAAFMSRRLAEKKLPPVEPLYTTADADKAIKQFIAAGYDRPVRVTDGVTVTYRDAGHILGSSIAHFHIGDGLQLHRRLRGIQQFEYANRQCRAQ